LKETESIKLAIDGLSCNLDQLKQKLLHEVGVNRELNIDKAELKKQFEIKENKINQTTQRV